MALPNLPTFYSKQIIYCLKINNNYHILHDFRTSTSFSEKFSANFKVLYKLKLLINFDVNPTSLPGGVMN